jgi:hypothetical protein
VLAVSVYSFLWLLTGHRRELPAPPNDTAANATVITLPFADAATGTGATTDNNEKQLAAAWVATCGRDPGTIYGVWYKYTAPSGESGIQASFSDGLMIASGTPGNLTPLNCTGGYFIPTPTVPGQTYYFVRNSPVGITVDSIPLPPTGSFTITSTGTVDKAGNALITVKYSCMRADRVSVNGQMQQYVGRFQITGRFATSPSFVPVCDGAEHSTPPLVAAGTTRKFARGQATATASGNICFVTHTRGYVQCTGEVHITQSVDLSEGT